MKKFPALLTARLSIPVRCAFWLCLSPFIEARAELHVRNLVATSDSVTFEILGSIDEDAEIGPEQGFVLFIGITGQTDWVLSTSAASTATNMPGTVRELGTVLYGAAGLGGLSSDVIRIQSANVQPFEPGDVIHALVEINGDPDSLAPGKLVKENLIVSAGYDAEDGVASVPQAKYQVGVYRDPPTPDTIRPTLNFLNKKNLKTPRPRHTIRGKASDNAGVRKVEAKVRGKGWKKAKFKPSGRWTYRTPRLGSGRNLVRVRVEDISGNRSKVKKVRPRGR